MALEDDDDVTGIQVTVAGPDDHGTELVTALIADTLERNGFTNVTTVNDIGEPYKADEPKNLLDVVRQDYPGFFARPIIITEEINTGLETPDEDGEPEIDDEKVMAETLAVLDAATY